MKGYKIIVLAKQVPDTRNVGKDAMKADGTVNRAALPAIFNPEDLNALEQALGFALLAQVAIDREGLEVVGIRDPTPAGIVGDHTVVKLDGILGSTQGLADAGRAEQVLRRNGIQRMGRHERNQLPKNRVTLLSRTSQFLTLMQNLRGS